MRSATEGQPRASFPVPSGVVTARIDPATGRLAYDGQEDAVEEYFLEGTVPTETATPPGVLDADSFLMQAEEATGSAPSSAGSSAP